MGSLEPGAVEPGRPADEAEQERVGLVFKTGDKVVYPHHGAGKVLDITEEVVEGETRQTMVIQILHNDMMVKVPMDSAEKAGIRAVIPEVLVQQVVAVLRADTTGMPKNWNRRFKHNRDKIKTGDIFEVADVVRNLAIRDAIRGLSTGEKQMFGRVKKILASELMYAMETPEPEAQAYLETLLEEICENTDDCVDLNFDDF
jgi:CarD family transcriptional regulator